VDGNAGLGEVKPVLARSASKVAVLGARAGGVAACGGVWDACPHEEWPGQHASWRVRGPGVPVGRVHAVDEVHRRRTAPVSGGGWKTRHKDFNVISNYSKDLSVI